MCYRLIMAATVLWAVPVFAGELDPELRAPVPVTADAQPIDVQRIGHAAPFVGDFNGNGLKDLLVGEFYQGRLRVYENVGTNAEPRFEGYRWFKAGAELGRVPTG